MAGTLQILTKFLNASPAAISLLDNDLQHIADYVNVREIAIGTLANRPAAGNAGFLYVASDVAGGTLYRDNGVSFDQIAAGVTGSVSPQAVGSFTPSVFL